MHDNNIQLEGLAGVVKRLSEDAKISFLAVDAAVKDSADENTISYMRRMYARAVIAYFDGITYRLMFHAYAARFRPETMLSADEIQRLEKYYDFDEDKEAQTMLSKSQMHENIRFAFRTFARVHYSDYVLPTHTEEWSLIKGIAHIRDTLLYPRAADQLEVYEENVETLIEGMKWFSQRLADLFNEIKDSAIERINEWQANEGEIIM